MEASKVTVGSRVAMTSPIGAGIIGEVLQVLPDGRLEIKWTHPSGIITTDQHWRACNIGSGLKIVEAAPAPAPVDWRRWLPPHPLPTIPDVVGCAGQVWAFRGFGDGVVFRIQSDGNVVLASDEPCCSPGERCTLRAEGGRTILIQDVDEPHPRDPATLWGEKGAGAAPSLPTLAQWAKTHGYDTDVLPLPGWNPGMPNLPKPTLGPPPAPTKPKCSGCDQERDLGATGHCWDCYREQDGRDRYATDHCDAIAAREAAAIKRTLMQPAALDPLWQRNPVVGIWRLRG